MQWLLTSHVHHYRQRYRGSGHVWQGRFKAFPICEDKHLLTVLRYIERNPLRATLVSRAEDWPWSSLVPWREPSLLPWLAAGPVPRPPGWREYVHQPQTEAELAALRYCVQRNAPFGPRVWTERTAAVLGLESSLRPPGRPPRPQQDATQNTLFVEKEP